MHVFMFDEFSLVAILVFGNWETSKMFFWCQDCVGHTCKPHNRHQNCPSTTFHSKVIHIFMPYGFWVSAILDFGNWATSKMLLDATIVSGIPENPRIDTTTVLLLHSYQKLYRFSCFIDFGWRPSWISVNGQCLKCFLTPPLCWAYLKTL